MPPDNKPVVIVIVLVVIMAAAAGLLIAASANQPPASDQPAVSAHTGHCIDDFGQEVESGSGGIKGGIARPCMSNLAGDTDWMP